MRLFDTHTHIDDHAFAEDLEDVLARAAEAGVERILAVGIDLATSRAAVGIARRRRGVSAAAGLHPHEASHADRDWDGLESIWGRGGAAAVGEVGLDYHYDHAPRQVQCRVFERSVDAACRHRLPLVVHCREAHADLCAILEARAAELGRIGRRVGVLHSFSGDERDLEKALALGFMISFAGVVTFRKADEVRRMAALVPGNRLLAETDCPYLSPVPHRGRRNEPAFVRHVVDKLAEVRGCSTLELSETLWTNAVRLFGSAAAERSRSPQA